MPNGSSITEFDRLPVPGAIFELDGTIIAVNDAGARLLERPAAALLGNKAWDYAPGIEHAWSDIVATAREHGEYRGEIAIATPSGARTIDYTTALRELDGRSVLLTFAIDVSHHVHAIAAAEQGRRVAASERLESLGLVAGGVAHEFNNLLVSVVAETSITREDETLSELHRDALCRIEASARRMTQLTRQLLAYAGRGRFVTTLLDPDLLVTDTRDRLLRTVPPNVELVVDAGAGAVAVEADRGLLRQVVLDLVDNAVDALRGSHGHVWLTSRVISGGDRPAWELEVRDDGAGMDTATRNRIFDPFFSTKPERRGLGLSAVLGIVRRLGGNISVESQPERGASFRVRLPIVPGVVPPRRRSTSKQPLSETLAGMRILVADDEPTVRATVQRLLERMGAVPVIVNDGAEAEQMLRTETFDLVLLDVMMPNRTGYQLVPIVRETQPQVPVILMSGYSEQARGVEPPDAFLEKPFNRSMLESVLFAALRDDPGRTGSEGL